MANYVYICKKCGELAPLKFSYVLNTSRPNCETHGYLEFHDALRVQEGADRGNETFEGYGGNNVR